MATDDLQQPPKNEAKVDDMDPFEVVGKPSMGADLNCNMGSTPGPMTRRVIPSTD